MDAPTALIDLPAAPGLPPMRARFGAPLQWLVAATPDEVQPVLAAAHAHGLKGRWCVGWVAYEAAPAFDPALQVHGQPAPGHPPLAMMAVFEQALDWPAPDTPAQDHACEPWHSAMSRETFDLHIAQIQEWIREGEVYQINLTTPLHSRLRGAAVDYFHALHRAQPASHAVYLSAHDHTLLCLSPELFFDWRDGRLITSPMKGTAPRDADPLRDQALGQALTASPKERAENLMIVDLLRNDLSRIAMTGSVEVPRLFELHALPTVWQMTSTIQARTPPHTTLADVFKALFPCGSVTGAPKVQAMRRIRDLEPAPRGIYCGAVGVIQPGGACRFAVPIRTVTLRPQPAQGESAEAQTPQPPSDQARWEASTGVGSGITIDSQADAEWAEWRHKQRFLQRAAQPFELLESMLLQDGQLPLLERHLQRLQDAAGHFGYPLHLDDIRQALDDARTRHPQGRHKLRLRSNAQGHITLEAQALDEWPAPLKVALAPRPIDAASEFVRFKTTQRQVYAPFAPAAPYRDTLLWNEQGRLTEFTLGNVALLIDGQWLTPRLDAGLLPGTCRAQMLAEGKITEADLRVDDLRRAQACAFMNGVRGWVEVSIERGAAPDRTPRPGSPA